MHAATLRRCLHVPYLLARALTVGREQRWRRLDAENRGTQHQSSRRLRWPVCIDSDTGPVLTISVYGRAALFWGGK
jgi:hypothetical protein